MISYLVLGLIVVLLFTGMPIAFVLGIAAAVAMLLDPLVPDALIAFAPFTGANNYLLVAVVLFLLAGEIMNQADIARRLIDFAASLVSSVRGGLAQVNILTSLFFAEISGTATGDAAAIGSVMIPQMRKRGYPVGFAAAVTAASSTMAILIPPSLNLLLYAFIAKLSVAEMFAAGIVPGIIVGGMQSLTAYVMAVRYKHPVDGEFSLRTVARSMKHALLPMTIPVVILGGILGGIFTATEAGAVASLIAILLAFFVYRTLQLSGFAECLRIAGERTAMLMFIVATSTLLSWYFTQRQIPQALMAQLMDVTDNTWILLLIVNVFILLAGLIIHATPAMLMFVPLFLPLAAQIGMDPIQFGIVVVVLLGIGQLTPPVASVVLVTCSIARISVAEIIGPLSWFILAMVGALFLVNAIPALSLTLPALLFAT